MSARRSKAARVDNTVPKAAVSMTLYSPENVDSLQRYHEIPACYQDNGFILSGCRPVTYSIRRCFGSLLFVHNETVNIYSHLVPAVTTSAAVLLGDTALVARYPLASGEDRLILAIYLVMVVTCFGLSASYHTLMKHSAGYSDLWGRIDDCGIMVLILGDFLTGIYVGFYCEPSMQKAYWAMASAFFR